MLLCSLNTQISSTIAEYVFPQYRERSSALKKVDEKLDGQCPTWNDSAEKDHSAVVEEETLSRTELSVGERLKAEPLLLICDVFHVVQGVTMESHC